MELLRPGVMTLNFARFIGKLEKNEPITALLLPGRSDWFDDSHDSGRPHVIASLATRDSPGKLPKWFLDSDCQTR